ncbi:hypothetical protein TSTA_116160 [Talaromyces stipitatus ATCC 10500]|uniref:Uncharacterized protein n=1 Tax=Talaromyces stipitatus (strain ATCC 10500 / CBS 375.48 / QM 6759 / NRRL 1006) TaxID=441959 RepID=B8MBG2_TALSN|nr:uncharacterized protein TSTA_116160 [Talaromyces stipitatus ATCC 10500]EED17826.1 hypothetical protein TSTA_116160 [Talaromyces stipitatus ATCC 10500]
MNKEGFNPGRSRFPNRPHVQEVIRYWKMLLNNEADVNSQGGPYGNALQAATVKEYIDVVQILLERGANINTQGGENIPRVVYLRMENLFYS